MLFSSHNETRFNLQSPTLMPKASAFLWNRRMMIQANCRGYAVAQFMQPEPAKYSYAPNLEAKTFMQPEQPYYAHHPGRFVYIKDEDSGEIFSAPYEPVRARYEHFNFSAGQNDIIWELTCAGIHVRMLLSLPTEDAAELWQITVRNDSDRPRRLSIYPYFSVGYMSWMNQSAQYRSDLGAVVASCVTPYQKYPDYFKNRYFKDKTYLLHERTPIAWDVQRENFEGEGGLHNPTALTQERLDCNDARYETPLAALQYRAELAPNASETYRFVFGPAYDDNEILRVKTRYLSPQGFAQSQADYAQYQARGEGVLAIETPDKALDDFVNNWLARQVFYHGDVNRLSTDPQTRNYLQDNMGMTYIQPDVTRQAFLHALSQQKSSGAMPDGILLHENAELKYINQIPHTDHCVWLPVCLRAYLDETADYALLSTPVTDGEGERLTVLERINRAMDWLLQARDYRGLSFIDQGDWCDPMNMVGYKGKGVSGWLSVATAYALTLWAEICERQQETEAAARFRSGAQEINDAVNKHLWDGQWYGRGITDDDVVFGISKDAEGRIFLNPQSWAILAGTCTEQQREKMIAAVEAQLETPYGVMMLAPSYTAMREDVGRVTQKHPGSAENGSVYNHAAVFYIFSLYSVGESERAYRLLRQMIPGPGLDDYRQRGQLPIYIPNYYRGAYYQYPRTAGRSSQLFNTGTVSWVYRSLVEGLFGLRGEADGLRVSPQLPGHWQQVRVVRQFRGSTLNVEMTRTPQGQGQGVTVILDDEPLSGNLIRDLEPGRSYTVKVEIGP